MRKPIKEFEEFYEVDEKGNIYSLPRLMKTPTTQYLSKEKKLKPYFNKKGYLIVDLRKRNIRKCKTVHRIVAETFIPNVENKPQINHKNGIKTDNRVENLEWCNNSENQIHAFANNLQKGNFEHHNSKLKLEDVLYIKNNYQKNKKGYGMRCMAKRFNVSVTSIQQILQGKSYRNI